VRVSCRLKKNNFWFTVITNTYIEGKTDVTVWRYLCDKEKCTGSLFFEKGRLAVNRCPTRICLSKCKQLFAENLSVHKQSAKHILVLYLPTGTLEFLPKLSNTSHLSVSLTMMPHVSSVKLCDWFCRIYIVLQLLLRLQYDIKAIYHVWSWVTGCNRYGSSEFRPTERGSTTKKLESVTVFLYRVIQS
jgi:hypothetical protein